MNSSNKKTLFVKQENGRYKVAGEDEILYNASCLIFERTLRGSDALNCPEAVRTFLKTKLTQPYEVFAMLLLDNRHRVIDYKELFRGTIDGCSVHPREVVKEVLLANAAAIVLAHNHPSGVAEPSQADIRITQRLKEALDLIDVRILDHVIVGGDSSTSFAERGIL